MTESAEGAGMRAGHGARVAGTAKARGSVKVATSRPKIIAIDDGPAVGDVRIVVVNRPAAAMPIETPMAPAPTEAAKDTNSETKPEGYPRTSQEEPWVRIPAWEHG